MVGASQLVDIGGDMETHQRESLRKAGTSMVSEETHTAGTIHSGGAEGVQEMTGGNCGRGCG